MELLPPFSPPSLLSLSLSHKERKNKEQILFLIAFLIVLLSRVQLNQGSVFKKCDNCFPEVISDFIAPGVSNKLVKLPSN